jgi:hypothetical protein
MNPLGGKWLGGFTTQKTYSKVVEQFLVNMEKKLLLMASVSFHDHTSLLNKQPASAANY